MVNSQNVLVTIRCLAYNHEPYIRQCLEGFVMQKTNFRFEAIVHDDASTDGTANIIREFEEKYSDIIKPIYQTENQYSKRDGSIGRAMDAFTSNDSKYIATCEGDDYWTDPYKLQKQVDFLEANPEYGLVYGKCRIFDQEKGEFAKECYGSEFLGVEEMLYCNVVPTLTVLYRKDLHFQYIKEEITKGKNWLMGDYPMWLYFAFNSKLKFLDEFFGVYRVLLNSATGRNSFEKRERFIFSEYDVRMFFAKKYRLDICNRLEVIYYKHLGLNALYFCEFSKFTDYFIEFQQKHIKKNFLKVEEKQWILIGITYLKHIAKEQDSEKLKQFYFELSRMFNYTSFFIKFKYRSLYFWYYLVKCECWNMFNFLMMMYFKLIKK